MSDTNNQMSLLDAIGLAPADTDGADPRGGKRKPHKKAGHNALDGKPKATAKTPREAVSEPAKEAASDRAPVEDVAPTPPAEGMGAPLSPEDTEPLQTAQNEHFPPDIGLAQDRPIDKYLCFALYSANHAMHGVYKGLLKEIGLTYPQFLAMTVLWETNNVPVGTVTAKLQLDTNTLTPLLKRLEAIGLLTRTRSPKDERQVFLKLTRKGKDLKKKTTHFSQCIFSSTGLSFEEVIDLQEKIVKLRDNLRDAGQG